jgi:hypothetical protein
MSLPVRQHRTAARFAKRPVIIERSANNGGPLRPRLCVLWKRHIHCRRDQQVRGHQSGGGVLTQVPRARRSLSLRAELRCCSIVVLGSAAQQSGGVASLRERPFRSPSPAVACLGGRLHSVSRNGDGAARRWGCNYSTLVSERARGESNLRDSGTASGNLGQGHQAINR